MSIEPNNPSANGSLPLEATAIINRVVAPSVTLLADIERLYNIPAFVKEDQEIVVVSELPEPWKSACRDYITAMNALAGEAYKLYLLFKASVPVEPAAVEPPKE